MGFKSLFLGIFNTLDFTEADLDELFAEELVIQYMDRDNKNFLVTSISRPVAPVVVNLVDPLAGINNVGHNDAVGNVEDVD